MTTVLAHVSFSNDADKPALVHYWQSAKSACLHFMRRADQQFVLPNGNRFSSHAVSNDHLNLTFFLVAWLEQIRSATTSGQAVLSIGHVSSHQLFFDVSTWTFEIVLITLVLPHQGHLVFSLSARPTCRATNLFEALVALLTAKFISRHVFFSCSSTFGQYPVDDFLDSKHVPSVAFRHLLHGFVGN